MQQGQIKPSFQPGTYTRTHTHAKCVWRMWSVRLEITPVHLCLWTNTHTYSNKECLRFVEPRQLARLACWELSLAVSGAFSTPSSANRLEKEGQTGRMWPRSRGGPAPASSHQLQYRYSFLITTVPMANPLCKLCFEHKLALPVGYPPPHAPSVCLLAVTHLHDKLNRRCRRCSEWKSIFFLFFFLKFWSGRIINSLTKLSDSRLFGLTELTSRITAHSALNSHTMYSVSD